MLLSKAVPCPDLPNSLTINRIMFDAASYTGLASHFSALTLLAAGPNDSWLTKWLTPVWFLGVGLAIGLVAIGLFILLTRIMSGIPIWERLSHSIAGHAVAFAITAAIAGTGYYTLIHPAIDNSEMVGTEKLMLGIALTLLSAIVGWAVVFCCSKQAATNAFATMKEGVSGYLWLTTLIVVVIGLISTVVVEKPQNTFTSCQSCFKREWIHSREASRVLRKEPTQNLFQSKPMSIQSWWRASKSNRIA